MSYVELVLTQEYGGEPCQMRFNYYNGVYNAYAVELGLLAASFKASVLPTLNAVQGEPCLNTSLYLRSFNTGAVHTETLTGGGDVVATDADMVPPYLPMLIRLGVGATINAETDAPYVGSRSIRYGKKFMSGFTADWMDSDGVEIPSGMSAAASALLLAFAYDLSGNSPNDHQAIVLGLALPPLPPSGFFPTGQPAAPVRRAPITVANFRKFTKLQSRDD